MLFGVLQLKHLIADFLLQPYAWSAAKDRYLSSKALYHSLLHAILTLIILLIFSVDLYWAALIAGAELAVHYHLDWLKARVVLLYQLTHKDNAFWWALGLDQFFHQITYIAIVYIVALSR